MQLSIEEVKKLDSNSYQIIDIRSEEAVSYTHLDVYKRQYEMCQLQELIIKKQDERWILYLNDEVMGDVEVKKGFLIKEFCFVWDRQKIDQRRQLYE